MAEAVIWVEGLVVKAQCRCHSADCRREQEKLSNVDRVLAKLLEQSQGELGEGRVIHVHMHVHVHKVVQLMREMAMCRRESD